MLKVIKRSELSRDEYALATFLQGAVNKKYGKRILIDVDIYLNYVREPYEYADLWELVSEYTPCFEGLAVYDLACDDVGINLAATVCAVRELLGVPRALLHRIGGGLPILFDAADCKGSNAERQAKVFDEYKDRLDPNGLVHQVVKGDDFHIELRDFAIMKGYFTFFTDETPEDIAFRGKVLTWANRNIGIYGWTTDEIAFLKNISAYGNYVVPMDWSANHSYFSADGETAQVCKQKNHARQIPTDKNKHYVAIVVSDGDNVQWLERNFATDSTYGQRMRSTMNYKINWTASPSMTTLCPDVLQGLYDRARADYFITGVSGIGYTNLLTYPSEHFETFADITANAMKNADLKYMCMLDNTDMLGDIDEAHRKLDILASHEEICGGIWELDPNRYESGKGRVLFSSNGKPFASVRLSLWHPSNKVGMITKEWLDGYIDKINSYPCAPDTIDGYTVLNFHPWTMEIEDLDYLVSRLGEQVEIVWVDEMLEMMKKNLKHEDTKPEF